MLDALKVDPVAFTIPIGGGFSVYWYGIIITLGIALGSWWGSRAIEKRGGSSDEFFNGLLIGILAGYFFARITYVLLDITDGGGAAYQNIWDVLNIRKGGANILGGFLGASVIVYLYLKIRGQHLGHYVDVVGPTLLLAMGIGRWGNFINEELYGPPTSLPWGILINPRNRLPEYATLATDQRFHPTFLYESILALLGFAILAWLSNRYWNKWRPGTLFGYFLIYWGIERFIVEFFRPDQPRIAANSPLTWSMMMSVVLVGLGIYVLLYCFGKVGHSTPKKKTRRRRTTI